ncbi:putative alpha-ketoglutarate-dependent taurine dioxygenase protein [Phaeoacremonium minimum UCRPA7]|uniref:Putative alpha-ketoglutarate-dependent taurine dioxygenase protein n=1 Tax=Phaeoacremonium minimum (strain UCR-PA7) TaxID=1286976 RepID=R8BEA0_PHAM7|nr:putative alpha-ketoglutarate-dependent taurine dioxygenase protein [Phaeoacremonium minimum UCRPA7]EON97605.1 putative alpha-ketoglutarate-dependent taurine dioxygenase protein [Phaeoacremonium minimum UCRPA7]
MAPSAVETITVPVSEAPVLKLHSTQSGTGDYKELSTRGFDKESEAGKKGWQAAKYPNYLPTWNPNQKYAPLQPFEHYEHGKDADTSYPDLLPAESKVTDLTPTIGSEVRGVQLSKLTKEGKDQLARYVAERKVVAFREQDFADLNIQDALDFGGYFGRHHIHPTSGSPEGHPEIHLVHRAAGDKSADEFFASRTSSVAWHSDVSYEQQPPGTTFLYILDKPETGGDTLFVNAAEAYNRLSPLFQERLHGLKAVHSGIEQVNASVAKGSIKRREPVFNAHPIVRTHPATGEKALYINPQFTREIVGLKKEESDALLKFLYDHLAFGADFQARVKWEEGTVVVWDNRVTQHSALIDWKSGQRRHLARITPQAERPYETPFKA